MVRVAQGGETFVHTSDVQGPPLKEHLSFLLDSDPTILYVDGPMTHMPEHYPEEMTKRSIANLTRILRTTSIHTLILDHHALRDRAWRERMKPVLDAGEGHEVRVLTAAEYLGKAVDQLEANRDRLYGLEGKTQDRDDARKVRSPFPSPISPPQRRMSLGGPAIARRGRRGKTPRRAEGPVRGPREGPCLALRVGAPRDVPPG
jgi:hypothetical protein